MSSTQTVTKSMEEMWSPEGGMQSAEIRSAFRLTRSISLPSQKINPKAHTLWLPLALRISHAVSAPLTRTGHPRMFPGLTPSLHPSLFFIGVSLDRPAQTASSSLQPQSLLWFSPYHSSLFHCLKYYDRSACLLFFIYFWLSRLQDGKSHDARAVPHL